MEQPVPRVSLSDLARVLERDFPVDARADVVAVLDSYGHNEAVRVKLAILKLAAGDVSKLRYYTTIARQDYRDVLAWAEYPEFIHKGWSRDLPGAARQAVIARDWAQYEAWLNRP